MHQYSIGAVLLAIVSIFLYEPVIKAFRQSRAAWSTQEAPLKDSSLRLPISMESSNHAETVKKLNHKQTMDGLVLNKTLKWSDLFQNDPGASHSASLMNRTLSNNCHWAHAIYMAADNNLESAALQDLNEIKNNQQIVRAAQSREYSLSVMIDRSAKLGQGQTSRAIPDLGYNPGTDIAHFNPRSRVFLLDNRLGERNMDDPGHLKTFLIESMKDSGCDHTFLELWNHGAGWYGFGGDGSNGHAGMLLGPMAKAIEGGLAAVGKDKLSLLGFDACLMSAYEVLSGLAPYAQFILASEDTEPGHGWDYGAYAPGRDSPKALGGKIIDGFLKHSYQNPRTLALIDGQKFQAFKSKFDEELLDVANKINNGDINLLSSVIRARTRAFDFASVVGKTDTVDIGSLLKNLVSEMLPNFRPLLKEYNSMFIKRRFSQRGYTGVGALFPDPNDYSAKTKKFPCYLVRMNGVNLNAWNKFVWATMSRGRGSMPRASCHRLLGHSGHGVSGGDTDWGSHSTDDTVDTNNGSTAADDSGDDANGGGSSGEHDGIDDGGDNGTSMGIISASFKELVEAILTGTREEAMQAASARPEIMEKLMKAPELKLSTDFLPWLSYVTVGPKGQMQIYGLATGELTDLKLVYGVNHVLGDNKLLVMGTARPNFRYTQRRAQNAGSLMKAPWERAPSCGSWAVQKLQRCGVFADWIGPTELIQGDVKSLVSVLEVYRDDMGSSQDDELVKIPVRYFDRPDCRNAHGSSAGIPGYLQGYMPPPGHFKALNLDGWTLVVTRGISTQVISARVGTRRGSFQAAQLEFDLHKADDSTYAMGHEQPFANEDGTPPTCFAWGPGGLASTAELPFKLKVYSRSFLPLTVILRGFDVYGHVQVTSKFSAISEQMTKYMKGAWDWDMFPKCYHTDYQSCGHLCACWSYCSGGRHDGKCPNKALQRGFKFVKADVTTGRWDQDSGCRGSERRSLCVAESVYH